MKSPSHMLLPVSVFITGASVLIVEVLGVRVLSPFYGNTIFTVSSVISVILLALSVGYYAGGKLADRRPSLQYFFALIFISGLLLLGFHVLGTIVLPALSTKLSITTGPLVSAMLLFLLPALLLGTLSPYAVKLQSARFPEKGVGSVAGSIFFWSTLGSIAGSLSAGFVLIPRFGIDRILIANGVVLCALGLGSLLLLGTAKARLCAGIVAFGLLFGAACLATRLTSRTVLYNKDGVYQKITIYDGEYAGRPVRFFQQDENNAGAGEGAMFLDSDDASQLVYEYTQYYLLYKLFTPRMANALVIGGGAFSVPKALLQELPNVAVDVVDIEPSLFTLAKSYFRVAENPRLHNHVEDGRRFLRTSDKTYDLIFSDVYYSFFSVPPHFGTKEFFDIAKTKLNPNGIFVVNMIGDLSRQQPSLIMAEIKTFQTVFPNSYFFAVAWPERTDSQNVMLVGYNSDTRMNLSSPLVAANSNALIRFLPSKLIDVDRRFELSPYPILTDNYAPVEYLTAQVLRRAFSQQNPVDGDEMAGNVAQQARYGSRAIGSPGHDRERDFLLAEMRLLAQDVKTQTWTQTGDDGAVHTRTNIIARFYTSAERRVVLGARYDTGGLSGSGVASLHSGAEDASGVAVLVELARALADSNIPPGVGMDFVFFDGRNSNGVTGADASGHLGSNYFADHLSEIYGDKQPVLAIVLDDVCHRNLRILKEQTSARSAGAQVQALWNAGRAADRQIFQDGIGPEVADDQTPLIRAGIPSVLLADSRSGGDDHGTCSAHSLGAVGQALLNYVAPPGKTQD